MKAEWRTMAPGTARNPASRNRFSPQPAIFEGILSHHARLPGPPSMIAIVIETERQQHRLLQPLVDLPRIRPRRAGEFLRHPGLARIEQPERRLDRVAHLALGLRIDLRAILEGVVDQRLEAGVGHQGLLANGGVILTREAGEGDHAKHGGGGAGREPRPSPSPFGRSRRRRRRARSLPRRPRSASSSRPALRAKRHGGGRVAADFPHRGSCRQSRRRAEPRRDRSRAHRVRSGAAVETMGVLARGRGAGSTASLPAARDCGEAFGRRLSSSSALSSSAASPSTALRAVPLPRSAGEDKRGARHQQA